MKKLLILLIPIAVVGCKSPSPEIRNLNLYQPSTLSLKAGTKVQTVEGIYQAQTDEIWHSDKRFRQLERKVYNK
jgi:hypothetical protein